MKSSFTQKGFTLVELLIVVIILAILAAIVVPQFSSTTRDANISALDSNLSNIRSVIDLYATVAARRRIIAREYRALPGRRRTPRAGLLRLPG